MQRSRQDLLKPSAIAGMGGRPVSIRRLLAAAVAALLASLALASSSSARPAGTLPPIRHVFVIVLENKGFDASFGPTSPATYLAKDLPAQGQLLTQYYGIGHVSLDNYVAMLSGQGPNPQTQSDCQLYTDFVGAPVLDPNGQAVGTGCVYPTLVQTLPDQLTAKGLSWKGYMEDMGTACRHPAIGTRDTTQSAKVGDQYAARHDPFVYFHSIIDKPACAANVVDLGRLDTDLASNATTANFSFITPNLCNDGHDAPCVDGAPGGLTSADQFLRTWVPKIMASPAYKANGLLVVTFDEADVSANPDASACCGELPGPNSPLPGIFGLGGGRTGAVVLSRYVKPGTVNATPYNHYSLLRSLEDLFGLAHLGNAGQSGLQAFGTDVYRT